jgi:hypothetical protein
MRLCISVWVEEFSVSFVLCGYALVSGWRNLVYHLYYAVSGLKGGVFREVDSLIRVSSPLLLNCGKYDAYFREPQFK